MSDIEDVDFIPAAPIIRRRVRPTSSQDQAAASYEAKKAKYWGPERNARRRELYATDPDYAENARARRRSAFARQTGREENPTCINNLAKVDQAGALMAITIDGASFVIGRVFTQSETALLLDRQPQVVYRWRQRGIFPDPYLRDGRGSTYFADDEVRQFIAILGGHQSITPHYRTDHVNVRERLFAAAFINHHSLASAWVNTRQ